MVEDTAVLRSLVLSRMKFGGICGMLLHRLLVVSVLAFTFANDLGDGGNPFILYNQYISSV